MTNAYSPFKTQLTFLMTSPISPCWCPKPLIPYSTQQIFIRATTLVNI